MFIASLITSRNFGSFYRNRNNGLLVPLADMLNHSRPRQTAWEYNQEEDAFVILAVIRLNKGDQVFDSYGRKDNRRLFFCYGFVEDDNVDGNGCSPNTVPIAVLPRHANTLKGKQTAGECIECDLKYSPFDENADCECYYNTLILDVVENDAMLEDKETVKKEEEEQEKRAWRNTVVDGTFGSRIHERTSYISLNSGIFMSNIALMKEGTGYDHSQSQYVYLSMCYEDGGTLAAFGIISLIE